MYNKCGFSALNISKPIYLFICLQIFCGHRNARRFSFSARPHRHAFEAKIQCFGFLPWKALGILPVTPPMYRTGHPFLPHVYHTVNFRFLLHQIEYEFGVAFVTHQLSLQPYQIPFSFLSLHCISPCDRR